MNVQLELGSRNKRLFEDFAARPVDPKGRSSSLLRQRLILQPL